ncbi:MAG: hypothetical protein IKO49_08270 [Bacilli bacterium]|nr:hypothetical protein [Bacilli bacterium]
MVYIYDILLNFMDGDRIYEFFEWDNKDIVEHIKRIPLYYVESNVIDDLLTKEVTFSENFLKEIENKTLIFTDGADEIVKYCFLFTNGERCYGFELNNNGKVIYKSSLLLDEEEEVLEISQTMTLYAVSYEKRSIAFNDNLLTRVDAKKNNFIEKDLIYTYKSKDYTKLTYLYTECFGYDNTTYKQKYERLLNCINSTNSIYRNKLNFILNLSHKLYVNK